MTQDIDLQFRPPSYFRPIKVEQYLLSQVKSAVLRDHLKVLFEQGKHSEVGAISQELIDSPEDRKALERVHPMFMGVIIYQALMTAKLKLPGSVSNQRHMT